MDVYANTMAISWRFAQIPKDDDNKLEYFQNVLGKDLINDLTIELMQGPVRLCTIVDMRSMILYTVAENISLLDIDNVEYALNIASDISNDSYDDFLRIIDILSKKTNVDEVRRELEDLEENYVENLLPKYLKTGLDKEFIIEYVRKMETGFRRIIRNIIDSDDIIKGVSDLRDENFKVDMLNQYIEYYYRNS